MDEVKTIRKVVLTNIPISNEHHLRLSPHKSGLPGWFGYAIKKAGYEFKGSKYTFLEFVLLCVKRVRVYVLCFNPSLVMALIYLLPFRFPKVTLFQWRPLGRLSYAKRIVVGILLSRADVIVVYSYTTKRYLGRIFPSKKIIQIGLYTDTNFFSPKNNTIILQKDYVFIPGDHLRNEDFLVRLAEELGLKIIRVTRNSKIYSKLKTVDNPNIKVLYNISFDELREYYLNATCVLILSDSGEIPTGITSMSEALACGVDVIINKGNSCSLPKSKNKYLPITIVGKVPNFDEIKMKIQSLLKSKNQSHDTRYKRRCFAIENLSIDAVSTQWREVLDKLGE